MKSFRVLGLGFIFTLGALTGSAIEYHVSVGGRDTGSGNASAPFRTISAAAAVAQPGDVITVHAGTYRERVTPPRGGTSDSRRIVYQAAPGERVVITGSELATNWVPVQSNVWKALLPNSFFKGFNPYQDLIQGDWFDPRGRAHHTGAVYRHGDWLMEAAKLDELFQPPKATALWYSQVDSNQTAIWAQFPGSDPNREIVEINARRTVFYPDHPGVNYLTVRGFVLQHAATPWAPPTAEQVGLIGTHWSQGWIIESNVVSHSTCSGIALGKYGDRWDNTSANTAEGYVRTIERALSNGWNRATIGHHQVRYNTISNCEQAGIVGSLGAAFSTVTGNTIHDIHVRRLFSGAEMAGIKFHAAIDTTIQGNHIYRTCRGLWLDWMAQGTRVSSNLFHDNASEDLFVEVDHGPFLVDNNVFLSPVTLLDMSEGGAFAHNLIAGKIISRPEPNRETPWHPAHATEMAGLTQIKGGDDRFYNNIFVGDGTPPPASAQLHDKSGQAQAGYGLWVYNEREFPLQASGNVYYRGARPWFQESGSWTANESAPGVKLQLAATGWMLSMQGCTNPPQMDTQIVTSKLLGKARIPGVDYENADGSPLQIARDYFGINRDIVHPSAGPFEDPRAAERGVKVW